MFWLGKRSWQDGLCTWMLQRANQMKEVISDKENRAFPPQHTRLDNGEEEVILDVQVNDGEDMNGGAITNAVDGESIIPQNAWEDVEG